jgi:trimeric autotransporter adhesin
MKAFTCFLSVACYFAPALLIAQTQNSTDNNYHITWAAPKCTKIPGNKNRISWTTAETVETKFYEVQRSADGVQFNTICTIEVFNEHTTGYVFEDIRPYEVTYYRICSVSSFGKKTLSTKIKAINVADHIVMRQDASSATFLFKDNSPKQIAVLRLNGQPISRISTNSDQHTMPTNNLSKGLYLVLISGNGTSEMKKMLVL